MQIETDTILQIQHRHTKIDFFGGLSLITKCCMVVTKDRCYISRRKNIEVIFK